MSNNRGFNPYRMTIDVMRFFVPEIGKRSNQGDYPWMTGNGVRRSAYARSFSIGSQ